MSTESPATPENDANLSGLGRALFETGGSKPSGPWVPPTAEELHQILPQYEIVKMLGRGGMGAVYMGTQTALDRPVAIKILSSALEDSDAGFVERFKNEARAMAKLKHPGIVLVYDFGETPGGLLYIVMEYVAGTDVARMIAVKGRLHTEHAMAITAHVCDALAYAHERGIIHRDIKPANVMVGHDGNVKVADFGLAKVNMGGQTLGLTQSGMAMGTLHFMAPEAMMLGTAVDHRADIYAVGVMLYQMLTGKLPHGMFKLPSQFVPGLDPRFDGVARKALMEDREARYQSVREMRADLDSMLTQPVMKAEAPVPVVSEPAVKLASGARLQSFDGRCHSSLASTSTQTMPPPRRSLAWLWLLIMAVAAACFFLLTEPRPAATASASTEAPKAVVETPKATTATAPQAATPKQAALPAAPSSPAPTSVTPAATTVEWSIPFSEETYFTPTRRQPSALLYWVESDAWQGVLTWKFADPRLRAPGITIERARLFFKTAGDKLSPTQEKITVTCAGKVIGGKKGAKASSWIEIEVDPATLPVSQASFDLSLRCGKDGVAVCSRASGYLAYLKVTAKLDANAQPVVASAGTQTGSLIKSASPPAMTTVPPAPPSAPSAASSTTWIDNKGRILKAAFKGISGQNVILGVAGADKPFPLKNLSPASQQQAQELQKTFVPSSVVTPATTVVASVPAASPATLKSTQIAIDLNLEDNRSGLIFINLERNKSNLRKTNPGKNIIVECAGLQDGKHLLYFWCDGHAPQWVRLEMELGKPKTNHFQVTMHRLRYVVIRSVFNTQGGRELTGPAVKQMRQAYTHWTEPRFTSGTDWQIWQAGSDDTRNPMFGDTPWLKPHRYSKGYGFIKSAENYVAMLMAPDTGYSGQEFKAEKGLTLYFHQNGNGGSNVGYGKLIVEDVTETPPPGVEVLAAKP